MTGKPKLSGTSMSVLKNLKKYTKINSLDSHKFRNEFFVVVDSLSHSLNQNRLITSTLRWSVNYCSNTNKDHSQSYCYTLELHDQDELILDIKFCFDPNGESSVEGGIKSPKYVPIKHAQEIESFINSPAYKRYFKDHSESINDTFLGLRAVLPKNQMGSRHFHDYLLHIISEMNRLFNIVLDDFRRRNVFIAS